MQDRFVATRSVVSEPSQIAKRSTCVVFAHILEVFVKAASCSVRIPFCAFTFGSDRTGLFAGG